MQLGQGFGLLLCLLLVGERRSREDREQLVFERSKLRSKLRALGW
jgi:hypothetical protein